MFNCQIVVFGQLILSASASIWMEIGACNNCGLRNTALQHVFVLGARHVDRSIP